MTGKNNLEKSLRNRFRFIGLRGKLLLVTVTILIFPIAGLSYLQELEVFLKNNHAQSVQVIARTIASVFKDNGTLISLNKITQSPQKVIYSHPLKNTIVIDGYNDDWFALQNAQQSFMTTAQQKDNELSVLCANDEQFYYFSISINKHRVQHSKSFGVATYSKAPLLEYIHFQYLDYAHQIRDYRFKISSPGWVKGYLIAPLSENIKHQIRAEWQENSRGYTLEFKIPIARINRHIAFQLKKDSADGIKTITSTVATDALIVEQQLNPLLATDPLSNFRLQQLVPDNTQLWLVNKHHYVYARTLASQEDNRESQNSFSLISLYRHLYLLIMNYPEQKPTYGNNQSRIENDSINAALKGHSTKKWLDNPRSDQLTLSITTPVFDNDNTIIGSLVLEQENDSVLALQDKTFERILLITIILFLGVLLSLLFFSTRLLNRIINLRNDTEVALSQDGLISNQLYRNDNDEIGDLARSFSTLLTQVEQNNQYLKSLSSKLSHELRTPLTIIKSSLENMTALTMSEDNQKYSLRAKEGCSRLNDLLNRMSEASRLEQSINNMEKETIEIVQFLRRYVEAMHTVHADIDLIFEPSINTQTIDLSPELMAQLLDKLLMNAISFHTIGTPIQLTLKKEKHKLLIEINNFGPLIDESKLSAIFNSLTSFRQSKGQEVHLGLGLYVANLIGKFHNGELIARNNHHKQSVSFILLLPLEKTN